MPAARTAPPHASARKKTQVCERSVPIPSPWAIAIGQHKYPHQCTTRQSRCPIRCRSALVTDNAISTSEAIAPSPSHSR